MAPLCAVIIVDYVIRKGNIHVPSCYIGDKRGLYWFKSGVNWYGALAWLLGTTMGIPGLIGQYQPKMISNAAKYMMGWLLTFFTSAIVYYLMTLYFKPRILPQGREDMPLTFEWLANEGREGFFDGERESEIIYAPGTPPMMDVEKFEIGEKSVKSTV
jgi:NCS1 family nucleobase:cation symporter-1